VSDGSKIEWTEATWNPVTGCTKVSPGCDHCYAERVTERFHGKGSFATVTLHPDRLDQPIRWRRPRRIFVNSMSDLFHDAVPDEFVADVFAVMAMAERHTFQVLSKRPARMRSLLSSRAFLDLVMDRVLREDPAARRRFAETRWPLRNVWLGVSVENQQWADIRVPALLGTPAAVRFLSCEPLLGPVNLHRGHATCPVHDFSGGFCTGPCPDRYTIDWVIAGGESGQGARPMHPAWARTLRDECAAAGVPFFFKQWGEWAPESMLVHKDAAPAAYVGIDGVVRPLVNGTPAAPPRARGVDPTVRRVGKKAAGRLLDGRTHDDYPTPEAVR
jgi:protein gp37